jgi:hypothetical protein
MIPEVLPRGYAPSVHDFAQAAGLPSTPAPSSQQILLCASCTLEGSLDVPAGIVMYHGTSVCAQHLASMVD